MYILSRVQMKDPIKHFPKVMIYPLQSSKFPTISIHNAISFFTALLITSLVTAAPILQSRDTYHGLSIGVVVSPGVDPSKVIEPSPVEINKLTLCHDDVNNGCSVSQLIVQKGTASNVDENTAECRGYKDFEGVVPGSAPFSVAKPADVSTNLGTVASSLCYIVEL